MRWIFYIAALVAALSFPVKRADVAKLQPVELVYLSGSEGTVTLKTDTGDAGNGATVKEALDVLKKTTSGIIYLDTAQYLVVDESGAQYLPEIIPYLKDKVRLCSTAKALDIERAAVYLDVHRPSISLKDWELGHTLEVLEENEGRFLLKKR